MVGSADFEDQIVAATAQRYRRGRNPSAEPERVVQPRAAVAQGVAHAVVFDRVFAVTHVEDVGVARPCIPGGDDIVTLAAFDGAPARDGVVAKTTLEGVGSRRVGDDVVAITAVNHVVARAAVDGVCSQTAVNNVITCATVKRVDTTVANVNIVAFGAFCRRAMIDV